MAILDSSEILLLFERRIMTSFFLLFTAVIHDRLFFPTFCSPNPFVIFSFQTKSQVAAMFE